MSSNRFLQKEGDAYFLRFGKYKACDLEDVAAEDPDYLEWVLEHIEDMPYDAYQIIESVLT